MPEFVSQGAVPGRQTLLDEEHIAVGVLTPLAADPGGKFGHGQLDRPATIFAYRVDQTGQRDFTLSRGEVVYETFSADGAVVSVQGVSIHPGSAKGKLVNALHLAAKIVDTLPQATLTPETTEGRQGFIHLHDMSGSAASATLHFILRDFEEAALKAHGELLRQVCAVIQATEPRARIECTITPQYRNMRYWLEKDLRPVELARAACRRIGVEPFSTPIRGGTDGSRLTELGVPTPNLFTGMQEIHGPLEWISLQDMARATQLCVELVQLWSGISKPLLTNRPAADTCASTDGDSPVDLVG